MTIFTTPTSTVSNVFAITGAQLVPMVGIIVFAIALPTVFWLVSFLRDTISGTHHEPTLALDEISDAGENEIED